MAMLVVGVVPAHGTGYWVTSQRWGSAGAITGSTEALVMFTEVRLAEDDPDQNPRRKPYACVAMFQRAKGLYAAACTDAPFTMAADLSAARATGSMRATVRRLRDHAKVGTTTLRYDVRWMAMTAPMPRVYGGSHACPRLPWAPHVGGATASTTAELVSFGGAEGTVSSATLGTVRFRPETLTWYSGLGESFSEAVFTELPTAPVAVNPECYSAWANPTGGRVVVGLP